MNLENMKGLTVTEVLAEMILDIRDLEDRVKQLESNENKQWTSHWSDSSTILKMFIDLNTASAYPNGTFS